MTLDLQRPLEVPAFRGLGLHLSLAELTRHILVTGSSGAGKSRSILLPLLHALQHLRSEQASAERASLLVIDPKGELGAALQQVVHAPQPVGVDGTPPVDLFAGLDRSQLTAGAVIDRWIALSGTDWSAARDPFWHVNARAVLVDVAQLDLQSVRPGDSPADAQVRRAVFWRQLANTLRASALISDAELRALLGMRAAASRYLTLLRLLPRSSSDSDKGKTGRTAEILAQCVATHFPTAHLPNLPRLSQMASETSTSIVSTAVALLGALTSSRVQQQISIDPLAAAKRGSRINFTESIRRGEAHVFIPDDAGEESACTIRGLKLAWYDAVLHGAALNPSGQLDRLAVLVLDEYQRAITMTGVSDAQFTDRCRSLGGCIIAASQSVAALRERLREGDEYALRALLTNFGTRLIMATMDPLTITETQSIVPAPPAGFPHLLQVRPPAMFAPGEALWIKAGAYGIGKVQLPNSVEG